MLNEVLLPVLNELRNIGYYFICS